MRAPPAIPKILCAGRLYCDLVFTGAPRLPTLGTEVFAEGLELHAGGGAFITAATLAALGQPAALAATMPAAPFTDLVRRDIAQSGVDLTLCAPAPPGSDPQITVALVGADDRAFLSRRAGRAIPPLEAAQLSRLRHLHIGELRSLVEHPDLIGQARAAGMTVSLDCGWDDDLLSDKDGLADLIAAVDVFLPNQDEAARLCDLGLPEQMAPVTVIKCGASGARARHGTADWDQVAGQPVEVIDTTGAGDAFNGGFLTQWLAGAPLKSCLETGNICGAIAVQALGGTGGSSKIRDLPPFPDVHIAS